MTLRSNGFFLPIALLVLSCATNRLAIAALEPKEISSPSTPREESAAPAAEQETPSAINSMSVSSPEEQSAQSTQSVTEESEETFHYSEAMAGGLGFSFSSEDNDKLSVIFAFHYLLRTDIPRRWEVGADLFSKGEGAFYYGYRHYFFYPEYIRPYARASIALRGHGFDGLAIFFDQDSWRLRGGLGMESVVAKPMSLFTGFDVEAGLSETAFIFRLGLTFGW